MSPSLDTWQRDEDFFTVREWIQQHMKSLWFFWIVYFLSALCPKPTGNDKTSAAQLLSCFSPWTESGRKKANISRWCVRKKTFGSKVHKFIQSLVFLSAASDEGGESCGWERGMIKKNVQIMHSNINFMSQRLLPDTASAPGTTKFPF